LFSPSFHAHGVPVSSAGLKSNQIVNVHCFASGNAAIQIMVGGEAKVVSPEEVGAGILSYLKKVPQPAACCRSFYASFYAGRGLS
jgi:hypothetical protein